MLNVQADLMERMRAAIPDAVVLPYPPDPVPARLVTVRREGGRRLDRLRDRPGIGICAWGASEAAAQALADEVADFMETLRFADGYALVVQEAMYSQPDPDTGCPRWYLSYTLTTFEPKEA